MKPIDLPPVVFMIRRDMYDSQIRKPFTAPFLQMDNLRQTGMLLDVRQGRKDDQAYPEV